MLRHRIRAVPAGAAALLLLLLPPCFLEADTSSRVVPGGARRPAAAPSTGSTAQGTRAVSADRSAMLTRPERTAFRETSSYDDVIAFMRAMAAASPRVHLTTYGYTHEGRPMPLAVVGAPAATPEAVLKTGKTRVYIQGNIHAGEVEGKEAALWLLRSIARGERARWLDSVVLLVNPIYNADGNEKVSLRNRGRQNGPIGGMGQRANGQNLDLNRDCTKLETPEARSLANLLTAYDPHVAADLHTTNGSPHGFYVTYQTSVSPNTSPGITDVVRGRLFPDVTKAVKAKHGWDYFYYGNLSRQGERAWYNDVDLYKPRYTQTYFGVRNRLGILVETYAYATFEDRIKANYWFLEETLDWIARNGQAVQRVTRAADGESIVGKPQALRGKLVKEAAPVPIVLADIVEERNPYVPDRPMLRRVAGSERTEMMPHYAVVEPTETATAPRFYVLPIPPPGAPAQAAAPPPQTGRAPGMPPGASFGRPGLPSRPFASVADRLEAHGVKYFRLANERSAKGERFRITRNTAETQDYQNHKLRTLEGAWEPADLALPAGSIVIPVQQPLGRLAFVLLEPRSDDGFAAWNVLDEELAKMPPPEFYPVVRTMDDVPR